MKNNDVIALYRRNYEDCIARTLCPVCGATAGEPCHSPFEALPENMVHLDRALVWMKLP